MLLSPGEGFSDQFVDAKKWRLRGGTEGFSDRESLKITFATPHAETCLGFGEIGNRFGDTEGNHRRKFW
jgi:hypothetical protein